MTANEGREQAWENWLAVQPLPMVGDHVSLPLLQNQMRSAWNAALASLPAVPAATKELIAEAREHYEDYDFSKLEVGAWPDTMRNLVAALSVSTTGEQGEWGVLTNHGEYVPMGNEAWARDNARRFGGSIVRRTPDGKWNPIPEGES